MGESALGDRQLLEVVYDLENLILRLEKPAKNTSVINKVFMVLWLVKFG